jgi:hypothetical protein
MVQSSKMVFLKGSLQNATNCAPGLKNRHRLDKTPNTQFLVKWPIGMTYGKGPVSHANAATVSTHKSVIQSLTVFATQKLSSSCKIHV